MRDIYQEIQENLDRIQETCKVRILLAAESGSRAWGFASPDSDYDVRFIYVREPREYLRIDPVKDVIEWQLDEVLDINGWDVKKALMAFARGNPNVMEWASSPIIYRRSHDWEGLKETAMSYFSRKSALYHYYGLANKTLKAHLMGEMVQYKKYFYALRPLLCCRWIECHHTAPPMEFETLLTLFDDKEEGLTRELYLAIRELLARKALTEEKDLNPQMPVIFDFIQEECLRQKKIADEAEDDRSYDYGRLNLAFCRLLGY